ncbi:hypothetical protein [Clostridium tertium]|uniref:SH3b domain-containing protein n=1 Tax=Clostridium tertium TaxID=1559 RepID=A0A6N3B6Q0_9CLOT
MKYIIFVLLISALIFTYYYYNKKIELLRKQLMISRRKSYNSYSSTKRLNTEKVIVKFSIPTYKSCSIKPSTNLYLSPLNSSIVLKTIISSIEAGVLDCADCNNETWFYVNIPSSDDINCRGWVNSKDISIFYSSTSSISKK